MTIDRRKLLGGVIGAGSSLCLLAPPSARAQSVGYTYDALGRLWKVTYPDGRVTTYTYDAADNRSQVTTGAAPPPPPLTASASPASITGEASSGSELCVATAAGGAPPYAWAWERTSGNTSTTADAPTASATSWSYGGSVLGPPKVSYWRCKVTDAATTVAYTNTVTVTVSMS